MLQQVLAERISEAFLFFVKIFLFFLKLEVLLISKHACLNFIEALYTLKLGRGSDLALLWKLTHKIQV